MKMANRKNRKKKNKSKAGATHYYKEDIDFELDGKIQQRINMQKQFEEAFIIRNYNQVLVNEFRNLIEESIANDVQDVIYHNKTMSLDLAKAQFNLDQFRLKQSIWKQQYIGDQLKRLGFNDEHFNRVVKGDYITDKKTLIDYEEAESKKRIDAQVKLNDQIIAMEKAKNSKAKALINDFKKSDEYKKHKNNK